MADQLRYNEGKQRYSYVLALDSKSATQMILGRRSAVPILIDLLAAASDFMRGHSPGCAWQVIDLICQRGASAAAMYQQVCEYGESKYPRGNYLLGAPISQYLDSYVRHCLSILDDGEEIDPESDCPQIAHILWNAIQADRWVGTERDDRLFVDNPNLGLHEPSK